MRESPTVRRLGFILACFLSCSLLFDFSGEGQPCPCESPFVCINGQCTTKDAGPQDSGCNCPEGEGCAKGVCYPRSCGDAGPVCPLQAVCVDGGCVADPCVGEVCDGGACVALKRTEGSFPRCEPTSCNTTKCPSGAVCRDGGCVDVSCTDLTCASGRACDGGICQLCTGLEVDNCTNGVDDDCDGLTDCEDPDCLFKACVNSANLCMMNTTCRADGGCEGPVRACPDDGGCVYGECFAMDGTCRFRSRDNGFKCGASTAQRCCNGQCINVASDVRHCGGCNIACVTGQACVSSGMSCAVPSTVTGRCSCAPQLDAGCNLNQYCWVLDGGGVCTPRDRAQCSPGQELHPVTGSCASACFYP